MRLNFLALFILLLSVLITPTTLADNAPCTLQGQENLSLTACQRVLDAQTIPDFLLKSVNKPTNWQAVEIAVNNSNEIAIKRLLSLGIPDAFFMQVIQLHNQQTQVLLSLDKNSSFNKRPVQNRFLYTWLDLPAQQTTVLYIIYATHGKTPLEPKLLTLNQLSTQDTQNDLINGVIFGVLLILIPILLFSQQDGLPYATSRSYILLILSELLFISQTEGYNFQFLWADYPLWNRQVPGVIGVILVLAHALFSISFFQVRQRFKGFFYAFLVVILLTIMGLLLGNTEYFTQWTATMVIIYAFLSLILGLLASVQQLPAAKFYLLGSLSLIIFNVILLLSSLFWRNPFPDISLFTYPKLAYAFESVFFIIAVLNQLRLFNAQKAQLRIKRQAETEQLIKAEQERLAALKEAKNKQLLLASASHDIAQPLSSIRFAIEALRMREDSSPVAQHIDKTLDYVQSLLKELITQARQEQSNPLDRVVLFELFEQLHDEFEPLAIKKGLNLSYIDSNIELIASHIILYRILSNLLINAIRYSYKGRIIFGVRRRNTSIELQVIDSGIGLLESDCQALMSPFKQGEHANSAGYGLGLFIVKTLCYQCQYDFFVSSKLGKGSIFSVNIPLVCRA